MKELDMIDISKRDTHNKNNYRVVLGEQKRGSKTTNHKQSKRKHKSRGRSNANRYYSSKQYGIRLGIMLLEVLCIFLLCFLLYIFLTDGLGEKEVHSVFGSQRRELLRSNKTEKPELEESYLTVNPYSRPGISLKKVNNIFVHYTANPGTSAAQNRSYFENLGITGETSASAHFIIGYEGEIIQCLPLDEIGYAVKQRNYDSISIECCYLDEKGEFTGETYESLLKLCGWLLREYKLTPKEVLRHYDEGGKKCPLYYVEHEDKWKQFLADLEAYILEGET